MPRNSKGFTLIELLVVIIILGLLAALALPKFGSTKERAAVALMMNDLHNLATSQEGYFTDYATYYNGVIPGPGLIYSPSAGVSLVIDNASDRGWAATARSTGTPRYCQVFFGPIGPNGSATVEGKITCTPS